jgi:outer membrane scaffolding protein for murein synthesis (MipA/OmpV family)
MKKIDSIIPLKYSKLFSSLVVGLAGAVLICDSPTAFAQTPSPLAEWQYSPGVPLEKMFDPASSTWRFSIGAAMSLQPRYEGAKRYHLLAGPSVDVRYRDLAFASTGEGIGVNFLRGPNWRASFSVGYDLGRRAADNDGQLHGMGNINPAPVLKLSGDYVISKAFPLVLRGNIGRSVGGTDGWAGALSAYLPLPGSSQKFYWFAGPSIAFGDARYRQGWYGVNPEQSARSGYRSYSLGGGVNSVGAGVTAIWFLKKNWFVSADTAVERFIGGVQNSPVVQRATAMVFDVSLNYQFRK